MPLLLFPPLSSRVLKQTSQLVVFYVWTNLDQVDGIQLWTDLDTTRTWHAVDFNQVSNGWYRLLLPLASYNIGRYEYTLKYQQHGKERWLGSTGQNGTITLAPCRLPRAPTPHLQLVQQQQIDKDTHLSTFKTTDQSLVIPLLTVNNMHSYMALARKSSSWLVPVSGTTQFEPEDRQVLLVIYIDTGGVTWFWWTRQNAWLQINGATLELHTTGQGMVMCGTTTRMDNDIFASFLHQTKNCQPASVMDQYLGYCTWNGLGSAVDLTTIDQALTLLPDIGYLIIDDGWQQQHNGYLTGFDADAKKFPGGLVRSITTLKQQHPSLRAIGVWHTLWGGWNGVHPPLSDTYDITSLATEPVYLVKHVERFYNDYYRHLAHAGVDFVKIDNQAAVENWAELDKHKVWDQYCQAVTTAMALSQPPIHSMAMAPYLMAEGKWPKGILRNSDDYFPDVPDSHPWHVYSNIMNSLWSARTYSILDFDMFQTAHAFSTYHATSRVISGGPIYITDAIGQHDPTLIQSLVAETRTGERQILRCKQPCRPLRDTVLGGKDLDYIEAWNTTNGGSVIGYWSMNMDPQVQCLAIAHIPSGHVGYISLGLDKGTFSKDYLGSRLKGYGGCVLVNVVPLSLDLACLGLLDKLNGTCAIVHAESTRHSHRTVFKVRLSHRGSLCGFLVLGSQKIVGATLDGVEVPLVQGDTSYIWLLDMTTVSLDVSHSPWFSIELVTVVT